MAVEDLEMAAVLAELARVAEATANAAGQMASAGQR